MKFQTPSLSFAEPSHHKNPTAGRAVYLFQRNQVPWAIWLQNWFLTLCFLPGCWCLNHQEGCLCLELYLLKAVSSTWRAWLHHHKHKGKTRKREIWLLPWPPCMPRSRRQSQAKAVDWKTHRGSTVREKSQQPLEPFLLQEWIKQHLNNISSFIWKVILGKRKFIQHTQFPDGKAPFNCTLWLSVMGILT